jgi:hypothetical protein
MQKKTTQNLQQEINLFSYKPQIERKRQEIPWPIGEVQTDLKAIDQMLGYMNGVESEKKLRAIVTYFTHKYDPFQGAQISWLCFRLLEYIRIYGQEMEEMGILDGAKIHHDFLWHLLLRLWDIG